MTPLGLERWAPQELGALPGLCPNGQWRFWVQAPEPSAHPQQGHLHALTAHGAQGALRTVASRVPPS